MLLVAIKNKKTIPSTNYNLMQKSMWHYAILIQLLAHGLTINVF